MDPRAEKATLRQAITQRISHLSPKERQAEGRSLSRRILEALPPLPLVVTAYFPVRDEADIRPLLLTILEKGYVLYLPRFEEGKMVFRQITALTELQPGKFDIPEPLESAPLLDPQLLSVALVPARAYNRKGERLGRGNGGFDIWIRAQRNANPSTKFWGVCLECQVVDQIPMEAHDERVDAVITARGKTDIR